MTTEAEMNIPRYIPEDSNTLLSVPLANNELNTPLQNNQEADMALLDGNSQENDPSFKAWLAKHKVGAGLGLLAVGAAASVAPQMAETAAAIGDNAAWAVPSLVATELAWNTGAGIMLASAGKKIGNPFTLHSRIGELLSSVSKSKVFRTGLGINIVGELGTASILTVGSVAELPPSSWPLTIGGAAVLMAPGVGLWTGLRRADKTEKARNEDVQ